MMAAGVDEAAGRSALTTNNSYKVFLDSTVALREWNTRFALDVLGAPIQERH